MNAADPVLDDAVLEELAELGRELAHDVLREVVDVYRKLAPGLLEEMELARRDGSFERLRHAAHSLKGASAQMGTRRVAALARELEGEARAARADRLPELLAHCREELARADAALTGAVEGPP